LYCRVVAKDNLAVYRGFAAHNVRGRRAVGRAWRGSGSEAAGGPPRSAAAPETPNHHAAPAPVLAVVVCPAEGEEAEARKRGRCAVLTHRLAVVGVANYANKKEKRGGE